MEGAVLICSTATAAQRAHKNLEFHYETSFLSELVPDTDLSDRHVGGMLGEVGMDRETMTSFMRNFVSGGGYAAMNLTHVLSLSEGVISSTLGHNSSGEHLPQVNESYLFSLDRMEPSCFRMLVGSVGRFASQYRLQGHEKGH